MVSIEPRRLIGFSLGWCQRAVDSMSLVAACVSCCSQMAQQLFGIIMCCCYLFCFIVIVIIIIIIVITIIILIIIIIQPLRAFRRTKLR